MTEQLPFGERLKKQRRALDLSRQRLADQVGCAEVTLRRIEAGTLKPSKDLASNLLVKVGIPQNEIEQWIRFARGLGDMPNNQMNLVSELDKQMLSRMAPVTLPTGTVIFLFCDLAGFSRRFELDPEATLELLAHFDQLLHPVMEEYGGKVFNMRGDNFVVAFTDPLRGALAAIYAQSLLAKEDWGHNGAGSSKNDPSCRSSKNAL